MVGTLENVRILHIEDNPGDALLLKAELVESASPHFVSRGMKVPDWQIDRVPNCREAKSRLSRGDIDVVVLDLGLPDGRGMEALRDIALASPSTPIIVLSGTSEPETAFESIHGGAQDYLVKGQADGDQIWRTIHFAVERQQVATRTPRS
jgi:DNA-binding response OmpR family regulator